MEALFIYIAKSTGLIVLFYCAYYFLLRKETFFTSNRWFLLTGLITAVALPFLVYTKVVWTNPASVEDFSKFQVNAGQINSDNLNELNWNLILMAVYVIGVLALLIKFGIDFYSLNTVIKGKKIKQQADFKFIDVKDNIAPFSYFEYIVYNSSMFTVSELENIIEHEKVHSEQNHTVDVLVSRLFCVLFWFNPVMWLYKKAITQNLEFIADSEAAQKISDKKAYQYTLLKITTHESCVAITNHFYQSLIKKRIVMLNKNQSKKRNSWKFYAVIPALAAFVILFQVEVIAKEKQQTLNVAGKTESVDVYKIKKNTTDNELKKIKENLKTIHNVDFEASEIKRNADNNLTAIKIDIKNGKETANSIQIGGNNVIKEFGVIVTTDKNGNKKVGIQTTDEDTPKKPKAPKTATSTKLKTAENVNVNSTSDTKNNTTTSTSSFTTVTSDTDSGTTTVTSSNGDSKIVISNSNHIKVSGKKLIIVDGEEMPADFDLNDLKPKMIKTMSVFKGTNAIEKYGDRGANGVIEIETHK